MSSTGRATCTRTAVDNTDDFPRPNTRVLQSLEQRTHHERVKNERMHETAFDSIAPVLSFVLFSHPSARENARAKVNSHFSSSSSSSNVENIIHQGFLFHRARASCLKEREMHENNKNNSLPLYVPNFDASLGNDVQANGLRNSGLGNREHYVCVSV